MPRIKIYQQYPRSYENIHEMIGDLKRIKDLGFNCIYINPMHVTGENEVTRGGEPKKGSLYAIKKYGIGEHFEDSIRSEFKSSESTASSNIKEYTQAIVYLGMIPIFDLVLKHVSWDFDINNSYIDGNWIHTTPCPEMNDVKDFKYVFSFGDDGNRKNLSEVNDFIKTYWADIFNYFWKPYIAFYMEELGFKGVRIDAIRYLPPQIQKDIYGFIKELDDGAIIFCELLFGKKEHRETILAEMEAERCQVTHITNSVYWADFSLEGIGEEQRQLWKGDNNDTPYILGKLNRVVSSGNVGFAGFHDGDTLMISSINKFFQKYWELYEIKGNSRNALKALNRVLANKFQRCVLANDLTQFYFTDNDMPNKKQVKSIYKKQKEKISRLAEAVRNQGIDTIQLELTKLAKMKLVFVAVVSSGGLLFQCGDEFCDPVNKEVFDDYHKQLSDWRGGGYDLSDFVRELNLILDGLPNPTTNYWTEILKIEKLEDCFFAIVHEGPGFEGSTKLVAVNLVEAEILIEDALIEKIACQAGFIEKGKNGNYQAGYDNMKTTLGNVDNILTCGNIRTVQANSGLRFSR